ncbi:hypothetical protein [Terriglobus albidus]|uniref:hypothetical protein n=1 Tax=Terriglobus albidus TaxID=1592106 RepID=UPI0021E0A63A|nr:hypothetical protein [Terriglobus albidus]
MLLTIAAMANGPTNQKEIGEIARVSPSGKGCQAIHPKRLEDGGKAPEILLFLRAVVTGKPLEPGIQTLNFTLETRTFENFR